MPIFEYICEDCQKSFEKLINRGEAVVCPACNSERLNKQYSQFGMGKTGEDSRFESLPLYKAGGCGCTPSSCGCKN